MNINEYNVLKLAPHKNNRGLAIPFITVYHV